MSSDWDPPTSQWNEAASQVWWNKYVLPYVNFNVAKTCTGATLNQCWASDATFLDGASFSLAAPSFTYMLLEDGSSIFMNFVSNSYGLIYIDINGLKKPNIVGKDIFCIQFYYTKDYVILGGATSGRIGLLSNTDYNCSKAPGIRKGETCGGVIQQDGWKISDDYPWN